jgi:hypothetical protein
LCWRAVVYIQEDRINHFYFHEHVIRDVEHDRVAFCDKRDQGFGVRVIKSQTILAAERANGSDNNELILFCSAPYIWLSLIHLSYRTYVLVSSGKFVRQCPPLY